MFNSLKQHIGISKGNFFYLFSNPKLTLKYLNVILIAVPVWYVMYLLVQFSPEMCKALGLEDGPREGKIPIMVAYIGITIGDVMSGLLSQKLRSRKKVLLLFITLTFLSSVSYFLFVKYSVVVFYLIVFFIGFATGYWAVFMSSASELFGTNIRATVTTTAPNFVRGSVPLMSMAHLAMKPHVGPVESAIYIGIVVFILAFFACIKLEETFTKDLNYTEI
jgi:MFS transporter, putative metabolite:H+ symporter